MTAFIRKHQVLVRLNHEPELSKLSPEELKRRLEQTEWSSTKPPRRSQENAGAVSL